VAGQAIKIGIISCAGEELPEGTISRLAVRRVLERLRPGQTVSICLPLFLAGAEGEREFARNYPTITIDGCDKQCAKWGTETYSGAVSAALVVTDILRDRPPLSGARSGRKLTRSDLAAVELVAARLAEALDQAAAASDVSGSVPAEMSPSCGCAVALPAGTIQVNGKTVEIAGLLLIFRQCQEDELAPDHPDTGERLLEVVRVYHVIAETEEQAYQDALAEAYRAYLASQ